MMILTIYLPYKSPYHLGGYYNPFFVFSTFTRRWARPFVPSRNAMFVAGPLAFCRGAILSPQWIGEDENGIPICL